MKPVAYVRKAGWVFGVVSLGLIGAWAAGAVVQAEPAKAEPPKAADDIRKEIGPNVVFEKTGDKRRVIVFATVCLRQGKLEHLLSRTKAEKQHESILTADMDASHLHAALLLTGAKPGKPCQFVNDKMIRDYKPATGDKIKVTLQYEEKGKTITVPGQKWIVEVGLENEPGTLTPVVHKWIIQTGSERVLDIDWVFAGSKLFKDPDSNRTFYGANEGRVICVSNFTVALLDLPIESTDKDTDLAFKPNTKVIPPLDTKVTVILEPMPTEKK